MGSTETERRAWASEQDPKLVTALQAREMFGNKHFEHFKQHLSRLGIHKITSKQWVNSVFYKYDEIDAAATEYLQSHPYFQNKLHAEQSSAKAQTGLQASKAPINFNIPDRGWSTEQFMNKWGRSILHRGAVIDILKRSLSIHNMHHNKAFFLVKILTDGVKSTVGIPGYRTDKMLFVEEAKSVHCNATQKTELLSAIKKLYDSTEISKLNPTEVVAVIFELIQTNPKQSPS